MFVPPFLSLSWGCTGRPCDVGAPRQNPWRFPRMAVAKKIGVAAAFASSRLLAELFTAGQVSAAVGSGVD